MRRLVLAAVIGIGCSAGAAHGQDVPIFKPEEHKALVTEVVGLIRSLDPKPYTLRDPSTTRYYRLSDGGIGKLASDKAGDPRGKGAFLLEAMGGAAMVQDYQPTGGPDCKPNAEEPLITYYRFHADPNASVMSVNVDAKAGAVLATGLAAHYVPAGDFCKSKAYIRGAFKPAFLYVPFATQNYSFRNFQAMGLSDGQGRELTGLFATAGFSARMRGYADTRYFGDSQALGDMPGMGAGQQDIINQAIKNNPQAQQAMKQIPGMLPGAKNEGNIRLDLSTRPASALGSNTEYSYMQSRMVHTGEEIKPGSWYNDLWLAIRTEGVTPANTPATPNGGSLRN
jgi:hypothetical protein